MFKNWPVLYIPWQFTQSSQETLKSSKFHKVRSRSFIYDSLVGKFVRIIKKRFCKKKQIILRIKQQLNHKRFHHQIFPRRSLISLQLHEISKKACLREREDAVRSWRPLVALPIAVRGEDRVRAATPPRAYIAAFAAAAAAPPALRTHFW